ncbi:MAG: CsgG/HfaB family protein [Gemmatimonas sp.]
MPKFVTNGPLSSPDSVRDSTSLSRWGSFVAIALPVLFISACATTGTSGPVSMRGGADSSLAAAVAREQAGGTSTSSAIGVPPFQLLAKGDGLSALGYAIADLLTSDLSRSARVTVVERSRLTDILREQDLVRSGRIDSASAPRLGKLLRARRLVLGSVDTMGGGQLRLSLRVADVESGVLDAAIDARAPLNDVLAAEKALALRLFDALGVTLTPAERASVDAYPTTSLAALTAYGRGVQADFLGDRRRAIDEFEKALVVDPGFSQARDRASQMRTETRRSSEAPSVLPGIRSISAPVTGTVDRVNRPIDMITSLSRPLAGPGDPSFPSTIVTVVITVTRP